MSLYVQCLQNRKRLYVYVATVTRITSGFLSVGRDLFWIFLLCWPVNEIYDFAWRRDGISSFCSQFVYLCGFQRVWTGSRLAFVTRYVFIGWCVVWAGSLLSSAG